MEASSPVFGGGGPHEAWWRGRVPHGCFAPLPAFGGTPPVNGRRAMRYSPSSSIHLRQWGFAAFSDQAKFALILENSNGAVVRREHHHAIIVQSETRCHIDGDVMRRDHGIFASGE